MPVRNGKQIRDRFLNSLDGNLNKNQFSKEEDLKIISLYKIYGNCWVKIEQKLNGRTGDMVKNRFYSSLKKIINNEKGNNKMNNHLLINKRMIYYENQFMLQDTISNSNFKNNKINNYNINLSKEEEEKNQMMIIKKIMKILNFKKKVILLQLNIYHNMIILITI